MNPPESPTVKVTHMRCLIAVVCSLGIAAVLAVPGAASNDNPEQQQQVWAPGKQMGESIAAAYKTATPYIEQSENRVGFDDGICLCSALLTIGKEVTTTRQLEKSQEYAFAAGCDSSVDELEMTLTDSNGKKVREEQDDAAPSFRYKPTKSGEYTLTIRLARIVPASTSPNSIATVIFLREGGHKVAPEDVKSATRSLGLGCTDVTRATQKKVWFHGGKNQWALFGAALEPGEEATATDVELGTGERMLLAVGDSNAEDVDIMILNDDEVLLRDKTREPFAFLKFTEDENLTRGIRLKNVKSKRSKPTLILSAILKIEA